MSVRQHSLSVDEHVSDVGGRGGLGCGGCWSRWYVRAVLWWRCCLLLLLVHWRRSTGDTTPQRLLDLFLTLAQAVLNRDRQTHSINIRRVTTNIMQTLRHIPRHTAVIINVYKRLRCFQMKKKTRFQLLKFIFAKRLLQPWQKALASLHDINIK